MLAGSGQKLAVEVGHQSVCLLLLGHIVIMIVCVVGSWRVAIVVGVWAGLKLLVLLVAGEACA